MLLKNIEIFNYRQLSNINLSLQENLTVLAGPNNSGKTTLISILKGMFNDKKLPYTFSDIPTNLSIEWVEKIIPVFQPIMLTEDKEKGIQKIIEEISSEDKFKKEYSIDDFRAQIQIDYDPVNDDIQSFADYLMDLDESKNSFYFIYTYETSVTAFEKNLTEQYDKILTRFRDIDSPECLEKDTKIYFIKEELLKLYCNSLVEKCFFCNSKYENKNSMDVSAFKKLFNFKNIPAVREVDDVESDTSKGISKRVLSLLKDKDAWVDVTKKLPDLLMEQIENSGAKAEIKNSSIKSLDETVQDISRTSGGHVGKLQLEMDVDVDDVEDFIQKITRAKYDINGLLLNEESQGLGFSNLIYLHMRMEEFYKSIDINKVNVFFIEEPESHMHPQMQNVFIRFLKKYYADKNLQGLLTTHSNEIVRTIGLECLRVIRQTEKAKSELFNLSVFRKKIKEKKVKSPDEETEFLLGNFFDWFFEIGYSDLVFADKVILYEGDTERLYIKKLLGLSDFSPLSDSYVAFIQVGGAYAHNYLEILTMLKIKSLIITDLDYDVDATTLDAAEKSQSTNATINHFYRKICPEKGDDYTPSIKELYDLQSEKSLSLCNDLIYLAFQDRECTARTLEEAMLNKLLNQDVFKKVKRSEWKKIRKENKLTFTVPNNKEGQSDSEFSIRRIVSAMSNSKTDFMYSVVLSGNEVKMLPDYIREGLLWLAK